MIKVTNLRKNFIKYEKEPGLKGMLKAFFNAKKVVTTAVDDLSFEIKEGEVVGYIGSNGAGKSTTIKMLTGILTPTDGKITVNGIVPYENRAKNGMNIGVVFGQRTQLWWDLPLIESFTVLKEVYQISDENYKERLEFFDRILGINEFIKSPVRTLSLGQRMKADITASLLHNPKVLYLDEPTIGLDVTSKKNMRQAIKEMNEKFKTTVILTTHDLDDIEELCERLLIIDKGSLVYDGSLVDIKERYGYMKTIKLEMKNSDDIDKVDVKALFNLPEEDLMKEVEENKLVIHFNKNKISPSMIAVKVMEVVEITDMNIHVTSIEDIVEKIYREGDMNA